MEISLIAKYDSTNRDKGYNVSAGGNNKNSGKKNPLYRKPRPRYVVEKIAAARKGKPWSEAQRQARKQYHTTHHAWNYGKKTPPEVVEKLRVSHMGQCRPHSEETKKKLIEANTWRKRPVVHPLLRCRIGLGG